MPTYDYRCEGCGHELAVFHSITEDPRTQCPQCHEDKLRRLIGSGGGIIFKGSGFYETDYKRSRSSSKSDGEGKSSEPKSKPDKKKESSSNSDSKKSNDS